MKYNIFIISILLSQFVFSQNSKEIIFNRAKDINALSFENVLELPGMGEESFLFSHETEIVAFLESGEVKKIQVTYKNKQKMDYFYDNKACFFAAVETATGDFGQSYFFTPENKDIKDEFGYGFNVAAVPYLYLYAVEYQIEDNKAEKYSVEAELVEVPEGILNCGSVSQSYVFKFKALSGDLQGTVYVAIYCPNSSEYQAGKHYKIQLASNNGGQNADLNYNKYATEASNLYWCRAIE